MFVFLLNDMGEYLCFVIIQSLHGDNSGILQSERLNKVLGYVNEVHTLCGVLGLDFGKTVSEVHPSLHGTSLEQSTNISNSTLEGLEHAILKLKTERKARIMKVIHFHHPPTNELCTEWLSY